MLFGSNKDVGGLRRYLNRKMANYSDMVKDYRDQAAADVKYGEENGHVTFHHQAAWLAWHAVELAAQGVAASEAAGVLHYLEGHEDDEAFPEALKKTALQHVLSDMRLNSRSSSASSNLAEDAKRAFWTEVGSIVLQK